MSSFQLDSCKSASRKSRDDVEGGPGRTEQRCIASQHYRRPNLCISHKNRICDDSSVQVNNAVEHKFQLVTSVVWDRQI
ncbi:hypothetical protein QQF64_006731 [Cirrhinus molitorella]|uniref:Uncharacterized protein n=1 Tax=Cirrhinus molitorella TaxID=172907 RepID=A0ABR3MB27_9TELE